MNKYFKLIKTANGLGKNKLSNFQILLLLFFGQIKYLRFFILYAYLRWVDDIVDDTKTSISTGREFLKKQESIVLNGSASESKYEDLGKYIFNYIENRSNIKDLIRNMFYSFNLDLISKWKLISKDHFYKRNKLVGYSGIQLIEILLAGKYILTKKECYSVSKFYVESDILADIPNDLGAGYCFIPENHIEKGKLSLKKYLDCKIKYLANLQPILYKIIKQKKFSILKVFLMITVKRRLKKIENARKLNNYDNISHWADLCRKKYIGKSDSIKNEN